MREVITRHRPHDVISGEEYGTTEVAEPSGYRWSIDPLDGTTNFVRGIIYYGTSVGLQAPDGEWVIGVVDAPALGRTWWAVSGQGAFAARAGSDPVPIHGPSGELSAGLLGTGFGYQPGRRAQQMASAAAMNEHFGNLRRLAQRRWTSAWSPTARSTPTPSTASRSTTGPVQPSSPKRPEFRCADPPRPTGTPTPTGASLETSASRMPSCSRHPLGSDRLL